jgi:GT2 family glycosyltransferase
MSQAPVAFVAIPVWRGHDVIHESVRALQAQTSTRWRATIAIDGADAVSAEACQRYCDDPRISVHVQPTRLGWAGNLNWLMARSDAEYFVYWPQDDFVTTNYLQLLMAHAERRPEVACAYAEVQWFGARSDRAIVPSVTGLALDRVRTQIETLSFLPFRGLVRRAALQEAGPLLAEAEEAAFEDLVWNVRLARAGELHLVPGPLYFKRAHGENTHGAWLAWPPGRRRAAWQACAMGVMDAALPAAVRRDWPALLDLVVDRFTVARPGRSLIFDPADDGPSGPAALAADLVMEAERRFGPDVALTTGAATTARLRRRADERQAAIEALGGLLRAGEPVSITAGSAGTVLLGRGWSGPEPWGTWSTAAEADLVVPPLSGDCAWQLSLDAVPFVEGLSPGEQRRITLTLGAATVETAAHAGQTRVVFTIDVPAEIAREGSTLTLRCPDAISPAEVGLSADPRRLGLAVTRLRARPA